jgi:hypothetical protein
MKGKTDFTEEEMCDLLSGAEAERLGGSSEGEPSRNVITEGPLCKWSNATSIVATFLDYAVASQLKSGPTITKTKIQIAGTSATQSDDTSDGGLCQVGFDLTDHSSLIVGVTVLTDPAKYKRCDVAKQVAAIILSKVK